MLPLGSLFVGMLAWAVLGEKLGYAQIIGMIVAVAGPVFMALGDMSSNALRGLLLGLVTACCFAINNFLLKCGGMRKADAFSMLIIIFLTVLTAGLAALSWQWASGNLFAGLDNIKLIAFAVGSGTLLFFGNIFLVFALRGQAGPASATANASSIAVLILDAIFYQPPLPPLKLIGMALTIVGVTMLAISSPRTSVQKSEESAPSTKDAVTCVDTAERKESREDVETYVATEHQEIPVAIEV